MGLKTTLDNFYERQSFMYGGGWISRERGVEVGTVRMINGILSQAWLVRDVGMFRRPEVLWKNVEPGEIREVKFTEQPHE